MESNESHNKVLLYNAYSRNTTVPPPSVGAVKKSKEIGIAAAVVARRRCTSIVCVTHCIAEAYRHWYYSRLPNVIETTTIFTAFLSAMWFSAVVIMLRPHSLSLGFTSNTEHHAEVA